MKHGTRPGYKSPVHRTTIKTKNNHVRGLFPNL